MNESQSKNLILVEVFKILNNRRTPNWALLLLVSSFAFFNWHTNTLAVIWVWLVPNLAIILLRGVWLYPKLDAAKITVDNVHDYLNLYSANVGLASLFWALALPFFFSTDDSLVLLVFIFTYFIFLVSSTVALSASRTTFLVFWFPLFASLSSVFLFFQGGIFASFTIGFLFFNAFILYLARISNIEVTDLIRLQLEKQALAESLVQEKRIAEKSVEDKNRFLAAASHDLRQPLHATGLLISALEHQLSGDTAKKLLAGIARSMEALGNSFRSLLDVSKLDAGVVEVSLENFSLQNLLEEVEAEFKTRAESKEVRLSVDCPICYVYTDRALLARVIRNLVSNAIKFTSEGVVEIKVIVTDQGVEIAVKDSGCGIPSNELNNIFSEYYQLGNPERDRNQGFGLGLAISKRLCDLLDIPITVESTVEKGSTFRLQTQPGKPAESKQTQQTEQTAYLSGLTILVIDDDMSILESMDHLLKEWGCTAICCESQEQVLAHIEAHPFVPDFIIADYRLRNNQTGTSVCQRIEEKFNRSIPSVIVTGDTSPDRLKEVLDTGYQILHKPVEVRELKEVMQAMLNPAASL